MNLKMKELARRAKQRRDNPMLRHTPNISDLKDANDNAQLMAHPQFDSIKTNKE